MKAIKTTAFRLYEGFSKTKTAATTAVLVLYVALMAYSGGSVGEVALFALVLAVYIVLPGCFAAHLLRVKNIAEGFFGPLALLLGSGFFAVLYCVSMRLHILWLLRALPPLVCVAFAVWRFIAAKKNPAVSHKLHRPAPAPYQWMLILLFAALLLLYTFAGVIKNGRPLAVGDVLLNQDLLWNVGNANSFKIAFPPQDIRFVGVRLHYHYLTELLAGAISLVSGISAYNIIGFYMQPFVLGALVLCLFRFGRLVYPKSLFKAMLFPYSLFLFSCASLWKILPNGLSVFWNSNITHLITNINSQATALVYLCIFCGLFLTASRVKYRVNLLTAALLVCALVMLSFAKGPLAALVVCAMVLTLLIGLFTRHTGWRGLALGAVLTALFVFIYLTMFVSGASDSMTLSLFGTLEKGYFYNSLQLLKNTDYRLFQVAVPVLWVLQSFLMMPAQLPLYVRGVALDVRRFNKLMPERLLFNGVAAGGVVAYFLFNHPAMSQTYFLFGAIFFVNLLAVDGVDYLRWPKRGEMSRCKAGFKKVVLVGIACFAAVGVATTGFLYVNQLGSGARQLARNLGITQKYPYDTVVTPDDEAAMIWLENNSKKDAMFATNRIHTGARREGISNLYSAFNERQGFMEGFQYAKTNMGVSVEVIEERLAMNEALFNAKTPHKEIVALCEQNGIDYLIFSAQMDGSDEQLAGFALEYDSPSVRVYSTGNS